MLPNRAGEAWIRRSMSVQISHPKGAAPLPMRRTITHVDKASLDTAMASSLRTLITILIVGAWPSASLHNPYFRSPAAGRAPLGQSAPGHRRSLTTIERQRRPGRLLAVFVAGLAAVPRPLRRVPENAIKFAEGTGELAQFDPKSAMRE
jgi:hypothetical protein